MIKNIVFDLGNVLISFRPAEYFEKNNYPEIIKEKILTDIFGSKEWQLLDSGDISTSDAINSISLKSTLNKEEIEHIFSLRTDLMFPLDQNVKVLPELKKQGYKLYFLSNFPIDIFEEVRSGYYFFKYFDGGIISAEAKASKPDSRIYNILLERYSLIPEECLFIDDIEVNVSAAEERGMKGLVTFGRLGIKDEIEKALHSKSEALRQ
jgi:epoxide hydrolase-like predicted phosphatase